MAEVVAPLLQVMIDQHCDICTDGVMRPVKKSGALSLVAVEPGNGNPPAIVHACSVCQQQSTYKSSYPVIKYVNFMDFIQDSQAELDKLKQERDGE